MTYTIANAGAQRRYDFILGERAHIALTPDTVWAIKAAMEASVSSLASHKASANGAVTHITPSFPPSKSSFSPFKLLRLLIHLDHTEKRQLKKLDSYFFGANQHVC